MSEVAITLVILAGALLLFVTELVPLGITPLIVLSSLAVSGVLPVKDVLTGFSNDTTIMVLSCFRLVKLSSKPACVTSSAGKS